MVCGMTLMISKKYKDSLLSGIDIHIVGTDRLQNELLTSYLCWKTNNKCFVSKNINNIPKNHKIPRLVLWDCQKQDLEDMMIELKKYNILKKLNNHIVLFNVSSNMEFHKNFILKGVQGFFYEQDSLKNFIKGIQIVLSGRLWFSREVMSKYIFEETENEQPAKGIANKLTQRQVEILSMIAVGDTNQEISKKLYISPNTVKNHLYNIFKKINVSNRIQASLWAAINL